MKRLLILAFGIFLGLCESSYAQQDILVSGSGTIRTIGRNLTWAGTGPGGFNNNFIFSPTTGTTGTCVSLHNDDSGGAHGFTFSALATFDPTVSTYTGNTGVWTAVPTFFSGLGTQVLTSATTNIYIRTSGAARVTLSFSGGSGASSVDIFAVDSQDFSPCVSAQPNTVNSSGAQPTLACNNSVTVAAAGGATTIVVPAIAGKVVYVCGFMVTVSALSTASDDSFISGTGAGCAGGPSTLWKLGAGSAVGSETQFGGVFGKIFQSLNLGDQVCLVNASPGGSKDVSVVYTQM